MLAIDDKRGDARLPSPFSLADHVLWSNRAEDDKVALTLLSPSGAERWSYGRLRASVLATAGGLLEAGLSPGDRLLLRLGNTTDFPLAFLGAIAAGILPVPTSAGLSASEINLLSDVLAPQAVIAEQGIACPRGIPRLAFGDISKAAPLGMPMQSTPDTPAYIVFTSGTSGTPVGVVHAHRAILARRFMMQGWYGLTPEDRMLHAGAFNWTYTLGTGLLDPWTAGATALILAPGTPSDMLSLLAKRHEATILAGAPGIFRRMLRTERLSLPALRHGLSAGEKLSDTLRKKWRHATGTELHEAFGQTECSTFISASPERPAPPGTLGYVQDGRAVAILGETGIASRGETGEIAVHRSDPGLTLGYLGEDCLRLDGDWFRTGDTGVMLADGAIEYLGRKDDVLTAGGFRLSPVEIEDAMRTCMGVEDAAAVDHRIDPDTVIVALHYVSAEPLDESSLRAHAEARLAPHKRPRVFIHHNALPRNSNGKLLRRRLRPANE